MKIDVKNPIFKVAGVMVLLICLLFYHVLFQGEVFGSPDTMNPKSAAIALQKIYSETGEFPLWQPWIFSGMPTAEAFTFISYLYFPSILLNLLFIKGLLAQFLHLFFAGLGGYVLLRSLNLSRFASFLGGSAFMLTPYMITMIVFGHGSQMMTAAYIPWVMWMTMKVMEKPSWNSVGLLAVFMGFQLQRAHAQIAYYTWMLAAVYVLFTLFWRVKDSAGSKNKWIGLGGFSLAAILGIGIALLVYLPAIEYAPFSVRGGGAAGGADYNYATSWSFHPKELLTFLLPSAFGFGGQTYWGFMPFTESPNYMGIIVLFLAIVGFVSKRNKSISWFLLGTTVLALFISFGKHFSLVYDLFFDLFPYFNNFRVPVMILILVQFNVTVLAAMGLDTLSGLKEKIIPRWLWIAIGSAGLWLLVLVLGIGPLESVVRQGFTALRSNDPNMVRMINNLRWEIWNQDAWILLAWLCLAIGVVWLWIQRRIPKHVFLIIIVVIAILDIATVDWRIIHPGPKSGRSAATISTKAIKRYFAPDPVINFLQNQQDDFRIYPVGNLFLESRFRAFGLESVGGYHPAKLKITNEFIQKTQSISKFPLLRMLNVHYLISLQTISLPEVQEVFSGKMRSSRGVVDAKVYNIDNPLPRAWFVETVEAKRENQLWQMINEATFSPQDVAYIPIEHEQVADNYAPGIVNTISRTLHELQLEVTVRDTGFLVVSEVHYPLRWHCMLDGQPAEVIETNKLIRGLVVPPGDHSVLFTYDRSSFNKGKMISYLSFVIVLGFFGVGYIRNRSIL